MTAPVVCFLADAPQHVETLALWHHAQWHEVMPGWSLEEARAELASHVLNRERPTTLVLQSNGELLGSVSLIDEDEPSLSGYGEPWLASLYVAPAERGLGYGKLLVRALVQHAAAIGVQRLYLFTPGQRDFYAQLGWSLDATVALHGRRVDLMSIAP